METLNPDPYIIPIYPQIESLYDTAEGIVGLPLVSAERIRDIV